MAHMVKMVSIVGLVLTLSLFVRRDPWLKRYAR